MSNGWNILDIVLAADLYNEMSNYIRIAKCEISQGKNIRI